VDSVNATIKAGEGYQTYNITEQTLRQGYTVIVEGIMATNAGVSRDGEINIELASGGTHRIADGSNDPYFTLIIRVNR
jgi:hypothetical protein